MGISRDLPIQMLIWHVLGPFSEDALLLVHLYLIFFFYKPAVE